MGKKGKAPVAEEKEMTPLYIDTTCNRDVDITTWEGMYRLLEEENPRFMEIKATTDSCELSEASITEISCSFLHRIVARLRFFHTQTWSSGYWIVLVYQSENSSLRAKTSWGHSLCKI